MSNDTFYLRQNVVAEPLINQWYAWAYLISPANAALVISNLHVKILEDYIENPEIHQNAHANPETRGGPFVAYGADRMEDIQNLLKKTKEYCQPNITLSNAITEFSCTLKEHTDGGSLEPLYQLVPTPLKGYVELVYDINHNVNIRFIESLLYMSNLKSDALQTVMLNTINTDYRAFALSTPRLPNKNSLTLHAPFYSKLYDDWFRIKTTPTNAQNIQSLYKELSNGEALSDAQLLEYFSTDEPQKPVDAHYQTEDIVIKYFGHACILIQSPETSILIDPFISYDYDCDIERFTYNDLPEKIDYLLITHAHQDHVSVEHLLQLRHKVKNVIVPRSGGGSIQDPSLRLFFEYGLGYTNVYELDEMQKIQIPGGIIRGIPFFGEHGDLDIKTKLAYLVELHNKTVLCVADSNNLEPLLYHHIKQHIPAVDILFIGMECDGAPLSWLYGPLFPTPLTRKMNKERRLNGSDFEKAKKIVHDFNCKAVFVYAMGQEPWLNYVMNVQYTQDSKPIIESDKLVAYCQGLGMPSERLFGKKDIVLSEII